MSLVGNTLLYLHILQLLTLFSQVDELHVFEAAINPLNSISANLIQSHLYKIALSSAQIQSRLQHVTSISALQLQQLSSKLDVWHGELPHSLQLLSLISADGPSPPGTRRPLLFMHMVHISSRIILYERVIQVTLSQPSNQSLANQIFSLSENVHQLYASFAQQLARIVGLLYEDHSVLSQCWLTM